MATIRKRVVVIDGNITMDVTVYFGDMFSNISLAVMRLTKVNSASLYKRRAKQKILFTKGAKAYEQT